MVVDLNRKITHQSLPYVNKEKSEKRSHYFLVPWVSDLWANKKDNLEKVLGGSIKESRT